jgi:hypothetical protein
MTPTELLHAELSLLLIKYGRESVIHGLAKRLHERPEELQRSLEHLQSIALADKKKRQKQHQQPFKLETLLVEHPSKVNALMTLHSRYENRTFLPELRDVKRFFERHGHHTGSLKSRSLAAPSLFKAIARLPESELSQLCAEAEHQPGASSLGMISDEILRRNR